MTATGVPHGLRPPANLEDTGNKHAEGGGHGIIEKLASRDHEGTGEEPMGGPPCAEVGMRSPQASRVTG